MDLRKRVNNTESEQCKKRKRVYDTKSEQHKKEKKS